MKRTLFHSFLSLLLFTASLLFLWLADLVMLDDRLVPVLGIKLAAEAGVVTVFLLGYVMTPRRKAARKTVPSGELRTPPTRRKQKGPLSLHRVLSPTARIAAERPAHGRLADHPDRLALTAPEFFRKRARLENRPSERDRWLESIADKNLTWHGTIIEIGKRKSELWLSLKVSSLLEKFEVIADRSLSANIAPLQEGDFVRVEGVFEMNGSVPSVRASAIRRLDPEE